MVGLPEVTRSQVTALMNALMSSLRVRVGLSWSWMRSLRRVRSHWTVIISHRAGKKERFPLLHLTHMLFCMWPFPSASPPCCEAAWGPTKSQADAYTMLLDLQNCKPNKPLSLFNVPSLRYFAEAKQNTRHKNVCLKESESYQWTEELRAKICKRAEAHKSKPSILVCWGEVL
jgi:hypothetical protein